MKKIKINISEGCDPCRAAAPMPKGPKHYKNVNNSEEARMHRTTLAHLMADVRVLLDLIEDADDLPEWLETKITKAGDYMSSAARYIAGNTARDMGQLEEATGEEDAESSNFSAEGGFIDPISAAGNKVSKEELFDGIQNNVSQVVWLLENDEEVSQDIMILLHGALKRTMELLGMKHDHISYLSEGSCAAASPSPRLGKKVGIKVASKALEEEVTDKEEKELKKIVIQLKKASKMHKGQAEKIDGILKEEDHICEVDVYRELHEALQDAITEDNESACPECLYEVMVDASCECSELLSEAEYRGRKVKLNKPMRGDVKKFKVYVKDPKTGRVKKVNFGHGGSSARKKGEKTMRIRKSNPKARRNFRKRHNCKTPGPKTKARYWSCRKW